MPRKFDKVHIVYNDESFEGYVESLTKNYLTIHEYVTNTYKTFKRNGIKEITVISRGEIDMELHYFTFGIGHTFAGHVQPIAAESENQALQAMFQTYGKKWAFHYTENQWKEARERGFAKERPLDLIDARKVILCTQ